MKRHLFYILAILLIVLVSLAACGTAPPAQPTPPDSPSETESDPVLVPVPTIPITPTLEPELESYPPPLIEAPVQATHEPGYPPPATFPPTVDPYPGGLVWIIRPVGVQCEEGTAPGYGDLSESVTTLTAAGLQVEASEMLERPVTAVCGSPTSAHYRIQIHVDGLDTAQSMGWQRDQN